MKYKTILTAKAEIITPTSEGFKAVASSLKDKYGFDLKPQIDLLYVRSCLVSAGNSVGVNQNDDIFTREAAWAARHTPVMKPMNWQHQDTDILGVMYSVEARDTDGNVLDISDDTVPDVDFDLWTEAAVFSLIYPQRAGEIEARAAKGQLFVSMEAWFDNYDYGVYDANDELTHTIARNQDTSFLDKHLRANQGAGTYRDPNSDQDMRIGRVLQAITFGGCGFVDGPANKRSVIDLAEPMASLAEHDAERQIEILLSKVVENESPVEETLMNANAQNNSEKDVADIVAGAVASQLEERDRVAAAAQEKADLESRANSAEATAEEVAVEATELREQNAAQAERIEALEAQLSAQASALDELIQAELAEAGATDDTPAEISKIDSADSGEAAFSAKISWIQNSRAALRERSARADELEAQLAEAEAVVREQDIRTLLGPVMSDEAVDSFVAHAADLSNDEYGRWRDEKELMVLEMSQAADDKNGKKVPPFMKKKEEKDAKAANVFQALLEKRRVESGMASPDTPQGTEHLINHPGGEGVTSGVNSGQLKTPLHKIAGSAAGDDPAEALEGAQDEAGVQLAGASLGDEGVGSNPFRTLASVVIGASDENEETGEERPGFDPVQ